MIVGAKYNVAFRNAIERAELKIPDGSSLLWAKEYITNQTKRRHPVPRHGIQTRRHGFRVQSSPRLRPPGKPGMTSLSIFVSLIKFLFSKEQPITGVDSIFDICEMIEKINGNVYLIGGTKEEAEKTKIILEKKFKNLRVEVIPSPSDREKAGMRVKSSHEVPSSATNSPHPNPLPVRGEGIRSVTSRHSSAIFVALGSPKQTLWIEQHREMLEQSGVRIAVGVGGAFAMISGILPRAPIWMRHHHLEWLWRLLLEPKRIKRIWNAVVVFPNIIRGYPH